MNRRHVLAMALLCAACADLPEIVAGTCGNGVIEQRETCDGLPQGDAPCRPPGSALACQLDCSPRGGGTRPQCPEGWGCSAQDVCLRATGSYRASEERIGGDARSLLAGDFDGDGRDDIVAHGTRAGFRSTKLQVHYFDRDAALEHTWTSPRPTLSLARALVTDDGRDDLVMVDGQIGLMLGQRDRTLLSDTYPTYFLPRGKVRLAGPLGDTTVSGSSSLLVFAELDGELQLSHPDLSGDNLIEITRFPGGLADLAGEPAIGDVFSTDSADPCADMAIAFRGATEVPIYSVCARAGEQAAWADPTRVTVVALQPPVAITNGPLLADVDGDSKLDVMVVTDAGLFVGFGDGERVAPAKPFALEIELHDADDVAPSGAPLAAGDLNGDGAADLVFASGFLMSRRLGGSGAASVRYYYPPALPGAAWASARIADLNGNGLLDVVAGSSDTADLDFFNGTGTDSLKHFVIPTQRPVTQFSIGDLDGDLIQDVAFAQGDTESDTGVSVAYGSPVGPPSAFSTVARAAGIMQVGVLPHGYVDAAGEMFLAYSQRDVGDVPGSAIAWFVGNGDRGLMCFIQLTSFASDMSLRTRPAVRGAAGHFNRAAELDLVLLTFDANDWTWELWSLPDVRSRRGRPQSLGAPLDPAHAPILPTVRPTNPAAEARLSAQMAAADLDADGIDELVFVTPDSTGERCLLSTARMVDGALSSLQRLELQPACLDDTALSVADLDGDAASELLLLIGSDAGSRRLLLLWNDGAGGFSESEITIISADDESPRAFALFRATQAAPFSIAYISERELRIVAQERAERGAQWRGYTHPVAVTDGTGVAAADVDGDGITDLAIADDGTVVVLRAGLVQ